MPNAHDWQESIHPELLARLLRPLTAPGIISTPVARRILGWAEYFSGRLPLLEELQRKRGRGEGLRVSEVPIVHGAWVQAPAPPSASPERHTVVHERTVVQAVPVTSAVPRDTSSASPAQEETPRVPSSLGSVVSPSIEPRPVLPSAAATRPAPVHPAQAPRLDPRPLPPRASPSSESSSASPSEPARQPFQAPPRPSPPVSPQPSIDRAEQLPEIAPGPVTSRPRQPSPPNPQPLIVRPRPPSPPASQALTSPAVAGHPGLPRVSPAPSPRPSLEPETSAIPRYRVAANPGQDPGKVAEPGALPHLRTASAPVTATPSPLPIVQASASAAGVGAIPGLVPALPATPPMAGTPPMVVSASPAPTPMSPPLVAPVDLELLVDRVQRKLLRRIAAERERKGGFE